MNYIKWTVDINKLRKDMDHVKATTGKDVRLVMNAETLQVLKENCPCVEAKTSLTPTFPSWPAIDVRYAGCPIDTNRALDKGEILITTEGSL